MKITVSNNNTVKFINLRVGQTFIFPEFDDYNIFMVVEAGDDVIVKSDEEVVHNDEFDGYAVLLNNGEILGFKYDEEVIPVSSELKVNK